MPPHSAPAGVDDEGMPLSETTVPALRPPAHRVSPRAVYFWFTRALVGWLALIAAQVLSWVFDWPVPPWHAQLLGVTLVVALVHLAVMPRWRFRVHRWELTDDAVYTRTGWWTQESRIAPMSRVQTVDTERGPVGRLFRLTKVTVTTASAAGPLVIDGLDQQEADRLAATVTAAAQAVRDDAT
jgi:membrane protein YdbS with pleckstrin-like domain